ncbi:DNA-binding response regulator [Streptomyces sp. NPDC000987]|uniref:response regulator transcription factor n=1 Tax=Streptomyces sp. NPDC000987 TaxID=3154374 RepID=UPI0033324511
MKRVLVVEPHPQVRAAISDLVEDEPGCELAGAFTTIAEAMPLVSELMPDVVLIDADTPDRQAQRLGELLPTAFLVFISTATEPCEECPEPSAKTPGIGILKSDVIEFLRSLTS